MKNPENKRQSLLVFLLSLFLCFGVAGSYVYAHPSVLKQFKSSKFSGSQYLKQYNSDKEKVPSLPNNPFEKTEDELEKEDSESNGNDIYYFTAYCKQFLLAVSEKTITAWGFLSEEFTACNLPLYILFHSWKSFLS